MAVLFVALGTANAQHDHGSHGQTKGSKDKAMHGDMQMKDGQMIYDVSVDFKHQLTEVYSASLELTDSFVSDKVNSVSISSTKVKSALGKVDMNLLNSSEAHMDWMMNLKDMNAALDQISSATDLNVQRTAYASFNQALYRSITAFGTTSGTIYYQYCPMALENKGGYWLSDSGVVRNPYLGSKMLSCGSTKETIN